MEMSLGVCCVLAMCRANGIGIVLRVIQAISICVYLVVVVMAIAQGGKSGDVGN